MDTTIKSRTNEGRAQGNPQAPSNPMPSQPAALFLDGLGDGGQCGRVIDARSQAERRERDREERKGGAQGDRGQGGGDPPDADEQEARRPPSIRQETERQAAQSEAGEHNRREETHCDVVRGKLRPPRKVQQDGDSQDVRVDGAMEESEKGHDSPILRPHLRGHLPTGDKTSPATRRSARGGRRPRGWAASRPPPRRRKGGG